MSDSNLISFLQSVITNINDNKLSNSQIFYLTQFYINYTTNNNIKTEQAVNSSNLTIFDLLAAGSLFYSTLTSSLDLEYKIKEEKE